MSVWNLERATEEFDRRFCFPASTTYMPMERSGPTAEIVPGTVFQFEVEHKQHQSCMARMYCGLDHQLGARLWLQEAHSLLRLSARKHAALPKVCEGVFRDDDGVALLLSQFSGDVLPREATAVLRENPAQAYRYFRLICDAVRTLHGHGLVHRDIWRGSFEIVRSSDDANPNIRLGGFEMSAFVASLADPTWRKTPEETERLREYRARGGAERRGYLAPETLTSGGATEGLHLTYRSDVFALGVVGYQWFIGDIPDDLLGDDSATAHAAFVKDLDRHLAASRGTAPELVDILRQALRPEPRIRPTVGQVISHLESHEDRITRSWLRQEVQQPLLLSLAPAYLARFLHMPAWKDLPTDDDLLMDVLRTRIEKDLAGGLLIHEPAGASPYVFGGDRGTLAESIWVLIGREAVYFCQPCRATGAFGRARQPIDWALHITYVVDRCEESLRDIAGAPLRRRIHAVRVVHYSKSSDLNPQKARGKFVSWSPLLEQVRRVDTQPEWQEPFRKGFEWWLRLHRAFNNLKKYAFRRVPAAPGSDPRTILLAFDAERDRKRIETDEILNLLANRKPGRPSFGDFFGTLPARDLGQHVTWHFDRGGRPERRSVDNARALVRRLSQTEIELRIVGEEFPPLEGWLRPSADLPSDVLQERQGRAVASMLKRPELMDALYAPRSFRGSLRAWSASAPHLGDGESVVKSLLAHFPFFAIQGPPGTGKTTVVAYAVSAFLRRHPGAKILVAAQSHFALDELATRLVDVLGLESAERPLDLQALRVFGERTADQVRERMKGFTAEAQAGRRLAVIGSSVRDVRDSVAASPTGPALMAVAAEWRRLAEKSRWEIQDRIWRGANLVFATCGTSTERMLGCEDEFDQFDWVIVEEAAKAWPAELVMPLVLGNRWALVGDHKQLPPFNDREIDDLYTACRTSPNPDVRAWVDEREPFKATWRLFERLFEARDDEDVPAADAGTETAQVGTSRLLPQHTLDTQFRMHKSIADVLSEVFYPKTPIRTISPSLTGGPRHGIASPPAIAPHALVWLDTGGLRSCQLEEGYWKNTGEAAVIGRLLHEMHPLREAAEDALRLAILTPYHDQNDVLRAVLPSRFTPLIHTTDSFQGREAEIVVVSLVRTNDRPVHEAFDRIGHLASAQRSNVLLSRAKHLMVIVGDFSHFHRTQETTWRAVCDRIAAMKSRIHLREETWLR